MKKIFLIALLSIFFTQNEATAAKIDFYRNILLNNSYTIRYENLTPAPRVTNRDRVELYGKSGLAVEANENLINKPRIGIIVCEGQNKYEEVGDGDLNMCRLSKNGEDFFFTKYRKKDNFEYAGSKKNRVEANEKNYLAELLEGKSFGDADMSRLLNAILPSSEKSSEQAVYKFIASGQLADGNFFEDYRADKDGITEVVRFYFSADRLIKISAASYYKKVDGKIDGRKCIIKISEFTSTPDRNLLNLPPTLKDVTKRKAG